MILAISDTHGFLPVLNLTGIDRILIAGDVCPVNDHSEQYQRRWLERNFYAWVEHQEIPVYLTLGNHDFVDDFKAPANLKYGTQTVVDDVLLFSWTPHFYNWAWMADEQEIASRLENVLANGCPPIWITHGPPFGFCDEVLDEHCGSTALHHAVKQYKPELVVCGHLHEGKRFGKIGATGIVNASVLDDRYQLANEPVVLDKRYYC